MAVQGTSMKAKQLAAQLIPRFFKFFPNLALKAVTAQFDLVEEEDLAVRSDSLASEFQGYAYQYTFSPLNMQLY